MEVIPFAFTSAFMKVGALDYIGKLYGKTEIGGLTIKGWFVHVRENIMEDQFNLVHNNLEDLKGLSFYERKEVIFNKEDLSDSMKYTATAATFMVELAEKTLSNMLTMTSLSTPNKVIGNILYALDEYAPNILRPVGMAAGVYYVYDEFFDSKAKESSLSTFAKKSGMHLTQEDLCYISFVDDALSIVEPDQENASASSVIHDREVDMVLTLVGCLDQAGIEVSA